MKSLSKSTQLIIFGFVVLFIIPNTYSQTKRIKRPKSRVGTASIDNFVRESFDLYDKVYMYGGYAEAGTPLDDDDIDVLEEALDDLAVLSENAPDILSDIGDLSVFKQAKATLQLNKSKKVLKYSIKTAKKLLTESRKKKDDEDETNDDDDSESSPDNDNTSNTDNSNNENSQTENSNISDNIEIYSKFDFVPGDKLLFFDDFSQDFVGDFPSKWNTNASGEIVRIDDNNWFELKSGYNVFFIPDVKNLPKDYTIEFDVLSKGIGRQTSSTARLHIVLSDNNKFNNGSDHFVEASLPFGQYGVFNIHIANYFNRGGGDINSNIKADIRDEVLNQPHIAISVTEKRFRLWVNEVKYVDVPRFIQELDVLHYLKFNLTGFKDGEERIFIRNLKVAKGGIDLRRKLLSEGKISTNGILFDSGSANIQPQSYGIIRQISQVLIQDKAIKLNIVGHTDADGNDATNLELSKSRAEAVKQALISVYKISGDRLQTDGKGETVPVGDNSTTDGKAQNRRVEFIKI
jgi:flagellar motor protein MotB